MSSVAQSGGPSRTAVFTVPFSAGDDTAVTWAVAEFDRTGGWTLFVFHPDPAAVPAADLAVLRDRFASHLAGRYHVYAGHPHDPATWSRSRPAGNAYPALLFVRAD